MRRMRERVLALLLALVMLVGMLPTAAFAADEQKTPIDTAIMFSDLHTSKNDYKESTVNGVMTAIKNAGLPVSSVTSCGDAFSVNEGSGYTGYTSTITGYIQSVFNVPVNYVWSDHDRYAVQADGSTLLDKKSQLVYGAGTDGVYGTDDDANYYVYSLSMGDLCSYDRYSAGFNYTTTSNNRASKGFTATVPEAIANFQADAAKLKKDRPLFITSHQPLYDNRNDNAWAEDWFDAINKVAESMDVAYFYGHNHKYDKANDYYYAKGSKMPVATADKWGWNYEVGKGYKPSVDLSSEEKTLNFTHLCAGYLAPSSTGSTSSTTREGTVVAVTIYDDSIKFTTYNSNGVYTGNYAVNKTVTRAHAPKPVTLSSIAISGKTEYTVGDELALVVTAIYSDDTTKDVTADAQLTGYNKNKEGKQTVTATYGGKTATCEVTVKAAETTDPEPEQPETPELPEGFSITGANITGVAEISDEVKALLSAYADYVAVDVTATLSGDTATVSVAIPEGWDTSRIVGISVKDGVVEEIEGSVTDGEFFTFEVSHFSPSGIALLAETGDASPAYYVLVKKIDKAGKYLIANKDSGEVQLLMVNGSSVDNIPAGVTVGKNAAGETISYIADPGVNTIWEAKASGTGYTLYNANAGRYLRRNNNDQLVQDNERRATTWTTSKDNAIYFDSSTDKYISFVNNSWSNLQNSGTVYIFQKQDVEFAEPITDFTVSPAVIEVERDSAANTKVSNKILVTYDDGTTGEMDLTLDMLEGDLNLSKNGTYDMSLTLDGKTKPVTIKVINKKGLNDFPTYPNPGSVNLEKTADPLDQNTGLTRVDLSTSGLPVSQGIDVIVMLDTSSSMTRCIYCAKKSDKHSNSSCPNKAYVSRLSELNTALDDMIKTFGEKNSDGTFKHDIRIAIRDFNGAVSGATARDTADRTVDAAGLTGSASLTEFTGSGLDAGAFVSVAENYDDLLAINVTKTASGTNYDYAFDAIYQMGQAIKAENGENQRELYVIFMSDGAPNYYNYYGSQGGDSADSGSDDWNYWLTGAVGKSVTVTNSDGTSRTFNGTNVELSDIVQNNKHYHFYHEETGNQHRMANAVKGDPNETYEIIRKATGLTGQKATGETNMYTVPGLGATMYSVAFTPANDGKIQKEAMLHVLRDIATSKDKHYFEAEDAGALSEVFKSVASDIMYAAEKAVYVDEMGGNFNLQMDPTVKTSDNNDKDGLTTANTEITVTSRPVYTKEDMEAGNCEVDDIGKPYGTGSQLERVWFEVVDGEVVAKSSKKTDVDNIIENDVICAETFFYNTASTPRTITLADGSTYELPAETFYWTIGRINKTQYTLSYLVYLEGSMEGSRPAGSYATNKKAELSYVNWVGNEVSQTVPSPVVAWLGAQVSYAFYLVDDNGNPLHADGSRAENFLTAYKVTQPVLYKTVNLNASGAVTLETIGRDVLPEGYELYDIAAKYTVTPQSGDGSNSNWVIVKGTTKATTYVMGYAGANDYSKELEVNEDSYSYTNTTVYFAVKWTMGTKDDTVVIDYGLPVDISVLANDMFGSGELVLAGVGAVSAAPANGEHSRDLNAGYAATYAAANGFGSAAVNADKVRYTLNKTSGMQMNTYEKFSYAVQYKGTENPGYYYGTVTVIPATTIYYEEDFLTFSSYQVDPTTYASTSIASQWKDVKEGTAGNVQGEDRPGQYSLSSMDANNIYGFDSVNNGMTLYSLGAAKKVTVNASTYSNAAFTFNGTGFDVISMTTNLTGTLLVQEGCRGYRFRLHHV